MEEFKGTKGEWKLKANDYYYEVYNRDKNRMNISIHLFDASNISLTNENEANAKLIAAAPDLLEALMSIENDNGSIPKSIWEMRNKAIDKALK